MQRPAACAGHKITCNDKEISYNETKPNPNNQGPLLLTWIKFNPGMDR